METAEWVEGYMRAGIAVLPLHSVRDGRCTCGRLDCRVLPDGTTVGSPGKHPLTAHGKDDATTDPTTVAEWLARWPWCNWGGRPPAGVVILDVDPRNAGDVEIAKLQERHGGLPATLTARTGSGGLHIWLTYTGRARGRLAAGIDVKTNTGYVVLPPSIHASGSRYQWINQAPAAHAPRWVRTILNPPAVRYTPTSNGSSIDGLVRYVTNIPEGRRNTVLFWAACTALREGHNPEPLIGAAVAAGLDHASAAATVRSAHRTVGAGGATRKAA